MRNLFLIGLFGIAATAAAEEWFVPRATRIRIANPSANAVTVDVAGKTIVLGPRETHETSGSARIASHDALEISAVYETELATASVPVLDVREALTSGFVPTNRDAAWVRTLGIFNPNDGAAFVGSFEIPAHAIRYLDVLDSSFTSTRPVLVFVEETNVSSGARVITQARAHSAGVRRRAVRTGPVPLPQPQKQTVTLNPSKDATLFENGSGSQANGAGVHLFAGMTATNSRRRALVHFDLASQIPSGSKVTSATLTMQVNMSISGGDAFRLHPVTTDWSEGASNAGSSRDGGGTTARTGDATWIHTSFNTRRWTNPGGDFNATPDATATVSFGNGTWGPSTTLIARIQNWVDQPATNFGWIILGNESAVRSAKRFASRENEAAKPVLVVEFER